jgi:hypothetical protein
MPNLKFGLLSAAFALAVLMLFISSTTPVTPVVQADGEGTVCDFAGNVNNPGDGPFTITPDSGNVISFICIKAGPGHPVQTGTAYNDGCYDVDFNADGSVTIERIGDGPDCPEISHVDYEQEEAPVGIEIAKDAFGSFNEECDWTIEKTVDGQSHFDLPIGGGEFDADYIIEVTKTCEDVDFLVTGTITITNTGAFPVTINTVSDVLSDGTVASVDCNGATAGTGIPFNIAVGGSHDCTYEASPVNDSATMNTAEASGTSNGAPVEADVDELIVWDTEPTTIEDDCATVTDPDALLNEYTCMSDTFYVTITWDAECGEQSFTNTATVTEEDTGEYDTDDATVTSSADCFEWCSPGYWRNHLDEAAYALTFSGGYTLATPYSTVFGAAPPRSNKGVMDGAPTNPTLQQVLQNPQWYGGDAFNIVGDYLSDLHPDVDFGGTREDNCPLD